MLAWTTKIQNIRVFSDNVEVNDFLYNITKINLSNVPPLENQVFFAHVAEMANG